MCTRKGLLALEENFGLVAQCDCGTVHVTVGPVSIALDSHALTRLHTMLGTAIQELESASEELFQPKPQLMHASHLSLRKVLKIKH